MLFYYWDRAGNTYFFIDDHFLTVVTLENKLHIYNAREVGSVLLRL